MRAQEAARPPATRRLRPIARAQAGGASIAGSAAAGLVAALVIVFFAITPSGKADPPTGGQFVYMSGLQDMRVIDVDGSNGSSLGIACGDYCRDLDVSPDGTKIAYVAQIAPDTALALYVADIDGTDQQRIDQIAGHNLLVPVWSPDSTQIAYVDGAGDEDVYVINADGSGKLKVKDNAVVGDGNWNEATQPQWSPNGFIYFAYAPGTLHCQYDTYIDTYPNQYLNDVSTCTGFPGAPGGGQVSSRYDHEIARVAADGSGFQIVLADEVTSDAQWSTDMNSWYRMRMSPDGSKIYAANQAGSGGIGVDGQLLDTSTWTWTKVAEAVSNSGGQTWSPDGSRIALSHYYSGFQWAHYPVPHAQILGTGGSPAADGGTAISATIAGGSKPLDWIAPPPPPDGPPPPEQTVGTNDGGCGINGCAANGLFADPVNSRTGAFTTSVDDLDLPGTGVSFAFSRSYTSADPTVGRLGPGWTDSYSASLAIQPNGDARLHGEDGQQLLYVKQGDGSFVGAPGSLSTLASVTGGYELLRTDQVNYRFDAQGRLLSMKDRDGQGVTLTYDGQNRLATVTDAANRQATISYNASNLVSQVQTQDGRNVAFGYTAGRLTSVTDVRGKTWTYAYDTGGRLEKITDPLNHAQVTNVYGADGRVQTQTDALGKQTTFTWNAETETATATDANQKVWTQDYDQGILVEEIDPLTNDTDLVRDSDLNTTSVTGPTNETTAMTYDAAGNLLTATAPPSLGSAQKTFVYNARNDVELVTDARGRVTDYAYNPTTGNLTSVTQDGIQVGSYTYDAAGRVETSTDGNEKTWTYAYFPATGYLQSSTDPLGNKTTYTYDAAGRVATRVDPKGNVAGCNCAADFTWTYTYNPAGQLLTEQNPLGHTTTNVYDDAGRLTSTSDALGRTTSYTYDDANRVLTETAPDPDGGGPLAAPVSTYTYDNLGNKLTETDPRGNTTTLAYDGANRLISTATPDPDGAGPLTAPVTTHTYDPNGNFASTVEPHGNVSGANPDEYRTTLAYDAAGRILTETRPDPDGAGAALPPKTTNVYDPVGNLASVKDGNDHLTSYTYDAAGRILTLTGPDLGLTTSTYDDAGNLLTRRDDNNHTTTFSYDDAGRLASETSPDPDGPGPQGPAVTSFTYDPNGNRLTLTDPNGNATPMAGDGQTTYGYDRANRQTSINYSDTTPDVTFTYDAVGNRLTTVDGSGTETRTYDNLNRLAGVARGSNTFSYVYDIGSNMTRRTYPGSFVADYTYDPLNRLSSVASGGETTSYGYDVASNLVQTTLPSGNGYVESRVYDRVGRLTEVKNQKGATVLSRFVSTLDPAGNPTQIVRTGSLTETHTYTYDANDRITGVCFQVGTCPGASDPFVRWTYDPVGNRLAEQRPTGTTSYTYDTRDRLLSAGATSFAYDQNGNQTQKGTRTFTYDLANRPKTTTQGSTTTTYAYDGDGKRLQASTGAANSAKTNFLWDVNFGLPQLARENNGGGTLLRRYVYGERRVSHTSGSTSTYYHYDPLGSVAHMTAASGATRWTYAYEPFGTTRTETSSGNAPTNLLKFTGEYLDPTGLYHLRARQYDAGVGRFLQRDPAVPPVRAPCVAPYVYVNNRSTVLVDPSGLFESSSSGIKSARFATDTSSDRELAQAQAPTPSCRKFASDAGGIVQGSGRGYSVFNVRRLAGSDSIVRRGRDGTLLFRYTAVWQLRRAYLFNAGVPSFMEVLGYDEKSVGEHRIQFVSNADKLARLNPKLYSLHTVLASRPFSIVRFKGEFTLTPPIKVVSGGATKFVVRLNLDVHCVAS